MKSAPIIQLSFAIVSEVFGTTFMKMSDGFTHPVFGLATAACYIISFALLTLALKHLSLGMAYGIWGGVGTLLTTLVGIVVWDEPFSVIVGIGMIAVVAGIALLSKGTQEAEEAAAKLRDVIVTVRAKAGANGRLFGSVTSQEIVDALREQHGVSIEKNRIVQSEPIKSFGSYEVKCKFGYGIDGTVQLLVIEK